MLPTVWKLVGCEKWFGIGIKIIKIIQQKNRIVLKNIANANFVHKITYSSSIISTIKR